MRVDLRDPGIEGWIETLAAAPGFKALRTLVFTPSEGAVFADGGCDRLLHAHDSVSHLACLRVTLDIELGQCAEHERTLVKV